VGFTGVLLLALFGGVLLTGSDRAGTTGFSVTRVGGLVLVFLLGLLLVILVIVLLVLAVLGPVLVVPLSLFALLTALLLRLTALG